MRETFDAVVQMVYDCKIQLRDFLKVIKPHWEIQRIYTIGNGILIAELRGRMELLLVQNGIILATGDVYEELYCNLFRTCDNTAYYTPELQKLMLMVV